MRRRHRNIILLTFLILMEYGILPEIQSIGFYCGDPKISHKYTGDTVTLKMLLSSTLLLPLFAMCGVEYTCYSVRRVGATRWSWFYQSMAWYREYLSGLLIVFFLTCVGKVLVGEPRPHFLDTCKPFQAFNCTSGYISSYTCTNLEVSHIKLRDASKSFPSGHASLSVYSFMFCAWYLQQRLVGVSSLVVAWLQVMFLTWALVCSITRITDRRHHWWDALAGAVLGGCLGVYTVLHFCCNFQVGSYRNLNATVTTKTPEKGGNTLFKPNASGRRLLTTPSDASQGLADVTCPAYRHTGPS
ncbi:phospholipid phosphatase homolog 1.2 homolog isoform X2 [Macrosteles quadrilineatus]|uniref:phospholipid phosphatase homolog 1.2 homolog isoform X2 n=1 Tax=Macrosteles quadrilineatus TaxID=74068 RepID=UPI0023E31874|nr:phospholipid phosphatase homolog 1.2 homolog isoform X2 [Macrosteles quadrilineatus]